jgi:hypothetical protein
MQLLYLLAQLITLVLLLLLLGLRAREGHSDGPAALIGHKVGQPL